MKKKMETMLLLMNKVKPIEDMDQQYQWLISTITILWMDTSRFQEKKGQWEIVLISFK
jgi:hypothetical protein